MHVMPGKSGIAERIRLLWCMYPNQTWLQPKCLRSLAIYEPVTNHEVSSGIVSAGLQVPKVCLASWTASNPMCWYLLDFIPESRAKLPWEAALRGAVFAGRPVPSCKPWQQALTMGHPRKDLQVNHNQTGRKSQFHDVSLFWGGSRMWFPFCSKVDLCHVQYITDFPKVAGISLI